MHGDITQENLTHTK